jgi:hypothetical protein
LISKAESCSQGFFSPGPHIAQRAGPHWAVPKDGYQLKPGQFVNSTGYLRMIFYPFLIAVSRPSALLAIQTGLGSLSQIIVQLLLFHWISLDGQSHMIPEKKT